MSAGEMIIEMIQIIDDENGSLEDIMLHYQLRDNICKRNIIGRRGDFVGMLVENRYVR